MFVSTTFLGSIDRLSHHAPLTGSTFSICGLFATLCFIVLAFVLYIGPLTAYLRGDYVQGSYQTLKFQNSVLYSGCDFKIAISFYSKETAQLINHGDLLRFLNLNASYISTQQRNYLALTQPCYPQYFSQMSNKPHGFTAKDCFIPLNGLGFSSQFSNNSLSMFGIVMTPVCPDPFTCTYQSRLNQTLNQQRLSFLYDHFYTVYFTAKAINQKGDIVDHFYQAYSTEWEEVGSVMPMITVILESSKIYVDNSIMPWRNNKTYVFNSWKGGTMGKYINQLYMSSLGTGFYMASSQIQKIYYRQYIKLDEIIGMLGGGIFLIFIMFWSVCHCISFQLQKWKLSQAFLLQCDTQNNLVSIKDTQKLKSQWWRSLIPFYLNIRQPSQTLNKISQTYIDIATLLKKLQVCKRNLIKFNYNLQYKHKILKQKQQHKIPLQQQYQQTEQQNKTEINRNILESIRRNPQIPQRFSNHMEMLLIYNQREEEFVNGKIGELRLEEERYRRVQKPRIGSEGRCFYFYCQKIMSGLGAFVKFFDFFGAKPNLCAAPYNYSNFGCCMTLLIIIIPVLMCSLTIYNMGQVRTYWDETYQKPSLQNITLRLGNTMRMAVCFPQQVFDKSLIQGRNRIVDFKFYQYARNGVQQKYDYIPAVQISQQEQYFDASSSIYSNINFTLCFKPDQQALSKVTIYGDSHTETEAYFGSIFTPYCPFNQVMCQSFANSTNQLFYGFISNYSIIVYLPQSKYIPQQSKTYLNPNPKYLLQQTINQYLSISTSIKQTLFLDTLHIINNYESWTINEYPKPNEIYLSSQPNMIQSTIQAFDAIYPYYKMKILLTGKIKRVVFTSYKVYFLIATIGGCFVFFYAFFGSFGTGFNLFRVKVKLLGLLYGVRPRYISKVRSMAKWLKIPYIEDDKFITKIENDMNYINIAKMVDNAYRLSTTNFRTDIQKDIALIYCKPEIDIRDSIEQPIRQIQIKYNEDEWIDQDQDKTKGDQKTINNKIQNQDSFSQQQLKNSTNSQPQYQKQPPPYSPTSTHTPPANILSNILSYLSSLNLFPFTPQLTLNNKYKITSIFGGICGITCIIVLCLLTSNMLTLYFSNWHVVSMQEITSQVGEDDDMKMVLQVGTNFKFMVSFHTVSDFGFTDVRHMGNVGLSVFRYKVSRVDGRIQTQVDKIDLVQCSNDYFKGFINNSDDQQYYRNISNAYCIPDNLQFRIHGASLKNERQFFKVSIYNKDNSTSLNDTITLLSSYIPQYHISSPILSPLSTPPVTYSIKKIHKFTTYQTNSSRSSNITLIKQKTQYNTAINPSNELPTIQSYQISQSAVPQIRSSIEDNTNRYCDVYFVGENMYRRNVVKKVRVDQIFGIVGGCMVVLFFGLGCVPRSYNQFKLRIEIGKELYNLTDDKHVKQKALTSKQERGTSENKIQLSEFQIMHAWIYSYSDSYTQHNYKWVRYATLLESRVSKDINIFNFMQQLWKCQRAIKSMLISQQFDICTVFPKKVVIIGDHADPSPNPQIIQQLNQPINKDIKILAIRHELSEWEIRKILLAKQNNLPISRILDVDKRTDQMLRQGEQNKMKSINERVSKQNKSLEFELEQNEDRKQDGEEQLNASYGSDAHIETKKYINFQN